MLPSLGLPATDGGAVDLAALPGRSLVIVYPWTGRPGLPNPPNWDDIPGAHGSTPELEGFRDRYADFLSLGVRLFGLSRQTTDYQT
jgi:peroxiredoxin